MNFSGTKGRLLVCSSLGPPFYPLLKTGAMFPFFQSSVTPPDRHDFLNTTETASTSPLAPSPLPLHQAPRPRPCPERRHFATSVRRWLRPTASPPPPNESRGGATCHGHPRAAALSTRGLCRSRRRHGHRVRPGRGRAAGSGRAGTARGWPRCLHQALPSATFGRVRVASPGGRAGSLWGGTGTWERPVPAGGSLR